MIYRWNITCHTLIYRCMYVTHIRCLWYRWNITCHTCNTYKMFMIQVEYNVPHIVRSIVTQGRNGCCKNWVSKYKIEYSYDCQHWVVVGPGNGTVCTSIICKGLCIHPWVILQALFILIWDKIMFIIIYQSITIDALNLSTILCPHFYLLISFI